MKNILMALAATFVLFLGLSADALAQDNISWSSSYMLKKANRDGILSRLSAADDWSRDQGHRADARISFQRKLEAESGIVLDPRALEDSLQAWANQAMPAAYLQVLRTEAEAKAAEEARRDSLDAEAAAKAARLDSTLDAIRSASLQQLPDSMLIPMLMGSAFYPRVDRAQRVFLVAHGLWGTEEAQRLKKVAEKVISGRWDQEKVHNRQPQRRASGSSTRSQRVAPAWAPSTFRQRCGEWMRPGNGPNLLQGGNPHRRRGNHRWN